MLIACLAAFGLLNSMRAPANRRDVDPVAAHAASDRDGRAVLPAVQQARLLDSYFGMLLAYLSFSLPFAIWMLQGFFAEVPRSLAEAAAADGAGPLKILFRIVLPVARSGVAVTAIFTFIFAWNEFLFAFLLTDTNWVTLPVALGKTSTPYQTDWGTLGAGGDGLVPAAGGRCLPVAARNGRGSYVWRSQVDATIGGGAV